MHVGLVARVEDHRIIRGVEHPVQRDGQFDDAEVGPEVSTGCGDLLHEEVANLHHQSLELEITEGAEVSGSVDAVEDLHWRESDTFSFIGLGRWVAGNPGRACRPAGNGVVVGQLVRTRVTAPHQGHCGPRRYPWRGPPRPHTVVAGSGWTAAVGMPRETRVRLFRQSYPVGVGSCHQGTGIPRPGNRRVRR